VANKVALATLVAIKHAKRYVAYDKTTSNTMVIPNNELRVGGINIHAGRDRREDFEKMSEWKAKEKNEWIGPS